MDFPLQIQETDWIVGLFFCYAVISGGWKGATMSKFLTYEDLLVIHNSFRRMPPLEL